MWESFLPTPGLNSMVIVVQNPLDTFNVTLGLLGQELTAYRRIKTHFKNICNIQINVLV